MKTVKIILIWVLGIMFILTGLSKLMHVDKMSEAIFAKAHYPSILFYVTALFELIGGLLLIAQKTKRIGAIMIIAVMLGAISTHLYLHDDMVHIIVPVLVILFAGSLIRKPTE